MGVLLVVVPLVFIWLSKVRTPEERAVLSLAEDGREVMRTFWLPDVRPGTMTPITIGSLAALAGLFIVLDARTGDRRLALAGFRVPALLTARLGVIAAAVLLTTTASLAVTAAVFDARQWGVFIGTAGPSRQGRTDPAGRAVGLCRVRSQRPSFMALTLAEERWWGR